MIVCDVVCTTRIGIVTRRRRLRRRRRIVV